MSILIPVKMPKQKSIFIEITPCGGVNEIINPFLSVPIGLATELPPHGRLGDLDALIDVIEQIDWYHQAPNKEMVHGANSAEHQAWYKEQDIYEAIENAETIIPADPEGGDDG